MNLSTTKYDSTIHYRDHRISRFPEAAEWYFEEVCEHLTFGGIHVEIIEPDPYDYYD